MANGSSFSISASVDIFCFVASSLLNTMDEYSITRFLRSLIALSLIMSLLQFKPAPMYILDEIDAALDLSHTQHIGSLFRNRFKGSQFIVVSLKEGLFTNANVLFKAKVSLLKQQQMLSFSFLKAKRRFLGLYQFVDGTSTVEVSLSRFYKSRYERNRTLTERFSHFSEQSHDPPIQFTISNPQPSHAIGTPLGRITPLWTRRLMTQTSLVWVSSTRMRISKNLKLRDEHREMVWWDVKGGSSISCTCFC